jgi:hypothetical protein
MAENEEEVKRTAQQIKGVLVPDGNNNLVPATQEQLFFIAFAYVRENSLFENWELMSRNAIIL